jgi:hypothetical protein
MSRPRGHADADGDWTAPRSREVRPITSGGLACKGCEHALAAHPDREACKECECIWFQGAPIQQAPVKRPPRAGGRAKVSPLSLPAVMGEGRAAWDSVLADSHTWGGKVTVSKPTGKQCALCRGHIRSNEVMVPIGGSGRDTVWAHKSCR